MPLALILLSTAKGQDFSRPPTSVASLTTPRHLSVTARIVAELKSHTPSSLASLLDCSAALSSAALKHYDTFITDPSLLLSSPYPPPPRSSSCPLLPAIHAFSGVAFASLQGRLLPPSSLSYACDSLRVLDPLYGVLRGSDAVQPYRLELGVKVSAAVGGEVGVGKGRTEVKLKDVWRPLVTASLLEDCDPAGGTVVFDASSNEYSDLFSPEMYRSSISPSLHVCSCRFVDASGKGLASTSMKSARGLFARYCCDEGVETVEDAKGFDLGGFELEGWKEDGKVGNVSRSTITFRKGGGGGDKKDKDKDKKKNGKDKERGDEDEGPKKKKGKKA